MILKPGLPLVIFGVSQRNTHAVKFSNCRRIRITRAIAIRTHISGTGLRSTLKTVSIVPAFDFYLFHIRDKAKHFELI